MCLLRAIQALFLIPDQPNILIDSGGHACLTDFGLASITHGDNSIAVTHAHGYTPRWTAPEILRGANSITREADVFSFGMVVLEVSSSNPPPLLSGGRCGNFL
jgi:serine/threonine protein kinase